MIDALAAMAGRRTGDEEEAIVLRATGTIIKKQVPASSGSCNAARKGRTGVISTSMVARENKR